MIAEKHLDIWHIHDPLEKLYSIGMPVNDIARMDSNLRLLPWISDITYIMLFSPYVEVFSFHFGLCVLSFR